MNLVEMVMDVNNDLDFDEINSIDDSPLAQQVAQIIKSTYISMMNLRNWPHLRKLIKLNSSVHLDRPTHLEVMSDVKELCFVNYNVAKRGDERLQYQQLRYIEPEAFLRKQNALNTTADNVQVVTDISGITFPVRNDVRPNFFTSFDDKWLVLDAYDKATEDTVQAHKVQGMAYILPTFEIRDGFVPDMPAEMFPALVEEAKSKASIKLRQQADQKSEQESQRQQAWLSRKARRVEGGIRYPDYGRNSRKMYRDPTFLQGR